MKEKIKNYYFKFIKNKIIIIFLNYNKKKLNKKY